MSRLVHATAYGAVLTLLLVYGCTSDKAPPTAVSVTPAPVIKTVCLPMKTYAMAQQQAVAAELSNLPDNDPLVGFIRDYGQMRAANRACEGSSP